MTRQPPTSWAPWIRPVPTRRKVGSDFVHTAQRGTQLGRLLFFGTRPYQAEKSDSALYWARRLGISTRIPRIAAGKLLEKIRDVPLLRQMPPVALVATSFGYDGLHGQSWWWSGITNDPLMTVAVLSRCTPQVFLRDRPPIPATAWSVQTACLMLPVGWRLEP